jgi:5'-nucleotidase
LGLSEFQNRRDFLKYFAGGTLALSGLDAFANEFGKKKEFRKLTILYTNDQHSRIEPFPDNDPKYAGQGGFAKRATLIKEIRKQEENVLLLDAGDIFQGTPYFNYYHGELEFNLMSQMGYDAVTLGNHDFDMGIENIVKQMPHAAFSFLNCNYDFSDTELSGKVLPYKIFNKDGLKIGVFGIGIELEGLVSKHLYGNVKYNDPVANANSSAHHLKHNMNCDYIVCLSHLGYKYDSKKISDVTLVSQTKNIDLVIGGHTHTFLNEPVITTNSIGKQTLITQVGWAGIWLGRIDIFFDFRGEKLLETGRKQNI